MDPSFQEGGNEPVAGEGRCKNCETPLAGPFCAACGQRVRGSARSLGTLLAEARDALVHLDGRLWRTLRALAFKPGLLTQEFFRERRARYIHPFRLYLVLSLVFFSLAALSGPGLKMDQGLKLDLDDVPAQDRAQASKELEAAAGELRSQPGVPAVAAAALEAAAREMESRPPGEAGPARKAGRMADDAVDRACDGIQLGSGGRLREALVAACKHHVADQGRTLVRAIWANIPRMMFLFLPMMALVMKALYWRPRRYYVEHLVFFLQGHAAVFLLFALAMALSALARVLPGLGWVSGLFTFLVWWWLSYYLWKAMRVFYGQGRLLTTVKFLAVGLAYVVFLSLTLVGTVIVSAIGT